MIRGVAVKVIFTSFIVLVLILVTPYAAKSINEKYSLASQNTYTSLMDLDGWKYTNLKHNSGDMPSITMADFVQEGIFRSGPDRIDAYKYVYSSTHGGKEIIHHRNVMYDKKVWTLVKKKQTSLTYNNKKYKLNEYRVTKGQKTRIIRYFYLINKRYAASDYAVKLHELFSKLRRENMDSRLYVFSMDSENNLAMTEKRLNDLTLAFFQHLDI